MKKILSSNQILSLLLIITWLSHAMYLYPLPSYRLSQTQEQIDANIPKWVSEDKKAELQNQYNNAQNFIHAEWTITFALCGIGILVGVMCWHKVKYWETAAFLVVLIYLILWFLRYSGNADRNLVESYLYQWELAKHLGGVMPYVSLLYLDGLLFLLQIVLLFWIPVNKLRTRSGVTDN